MSHIFQAFTKGSGNVDANTLRVVPAADVFAKIIGPVAADDPDTQAPVKVGARYSASTPAYTDGDVTNLHADSRGNLRVVPFVGGTSVGFTGTGADGNSNAINGLHTVAKLEAFNGSTWDRLRNGAGASVSALRVVAANDQTSGFSYLRIAPGQATTVVKASAGFLHSITLNSAATASNVTTIYDHASGVGTIIAVPNVVAATIPTTLLFDIAFATGLTIITGTANGGDMTVCFK